MTYELFIKVSESYFYHVDTFTRFSVKHNSPVTPMPLPEESADENLLVKIEGNSETIDINWIMTHNTKYLVSSKIVYNSTTNKWEASTSDVPRNNNIELYPVATPFNQLDVLRQFAPSTITDTFYAILILDNSSSSINNVTTTNYASHGAKVFSRTGTFTDIAWEVDGESPATISCSASFITGNNIAALDGGAPLKPRIGSITSPSAGQLTINIIESQQYDVAADRPDTTSIRLKGTRGSIQFTEYKDVSPSQAEQEDGVNGYNVTFTGLDSGLYSGMKIQIIADTSGSAFSDVYVGSVNVS